MLFLRSVELRWIITKNWILIMLISKILNWLFLLESFLIIWIKLLLIVLLYLVVTWRINYLLLVVLILKWIMNLFSLLIGKSILLSLNWLLYFCSDMFYLEWNFWSRNSHNIWISTHINFMSYKCCFFMFITMLMNVFHYFRSSSFLC